MICDSGVPYLDTYHDDAWPVTNGFDLAPYRQQLTRFQETGRWPALAAGGVP
jgi:hypothetical protein